MPANTEVNGGPLLEHCENEVVQIIHHSFTEYLLDLTSDRTQATMNVAMLFPNLNSQSIQKTIARTCINYLFLPIKTFESNKGF